MAEYEDFHESHYERQLEADEDVQDYSTPELLHVMLEWTDRLRPNK